VPTLLRFHNSLNKCDVTGNLFFFVRARTIKHPALHSLAECTRAATGYKYYTRSTFLAERNDEISLAADSFFDLVDALPILHIYAIVSAYRISKAENEKHKIVSFRRLRAQNWFQPSTLLVNPLGLRVGGQFLLSKYDSTQTKSVFRLKPNSGSISSRHNQCSA
jgi:hypothetical protein